MDIAQKPLGPLLRFWQPVAFAKSPHVFLSRVHARHGDPFTVHIPLKTVMTADPEGIRQIFTAPPANFKVELPRGLQRGLGQGDLRALGGEAHQRPRKLIAPSFHGDPLKDVGTTVHTTLLETLTNWPNQQILDILKSVQDIALEVIPKTVFGVEGRDRLLTLRRAVEILIKAFGCPIFIAGLALGIETNRWPPNRRIDEKRGRLAELLLQVIAERRALGQGHPDIIGGLMAARYDDGTAFTDEGLVGSLLTNLIAGRAGTSTLMAWVFAWLGQHPQVFERLLDELKGADQ